MGDPGKHRSKIATPSHPWQKERIDTEKALTREYAFRNKSEIWKMNSTLKNFFIQAKRIIANKTEQNEKEKVLLLKKLSRLGIIDENADIEDVLGLSVQDVIERRLQSVVFRKGLARSMKQARQFITHEHILVNGKKITSPSYLVSVSEENSISFAVSSPFIDEMHPERVQHEVEKTKEEPEEKKKPAKKPAPKEAKPVKKEAEKKEEKPAKKEEKKEAPKAEEKPAEAKE